MLQDILEYITSSSFELVSFIAGFLSILVTIISYYLSRRQKEEILNTVSQDKIENILATDNIKILGDYLTNSLEVVTIAQYSLDKKVSKNVNIFLKKIRNYLLTQSEVEKLEIPDKVEDRYIEYPQIPEEFAPIIDELVDGEAWNALAKLRRFLELHFKRIAKENNIDVRKSKSVSQLLNLLYKMELVSPYSFDNLKYAINISNKAIHGVDISREEADKAIRLAMYSLYPK